MTQKQLEFAIFCIENVAKATQTPPRQMYETLKAGLLDSYIIPSYDALHIQSKEYIVQDILAAMKEQAVLP